MNAAPPLPATVASFSIEPGLERLWEETLGDPSVCIAILDGPVDLQHPSLSNANLNLVDTLVDPTCDNGPSCQHGTQISSCIFGDHSGPVKGIAPNCRGIILPIYSSDPVDRRLHCSQVDLARAILRSLEEGANVINISGGQYAASGTAHPILADAVRTCFERDVLIVAAAGNDGCDCLHIPAALPAVLAVGAMNHFGHPLDQTNWGHLYRTQGLLAPGENILTATAGGGVALSTGTSFATAHVSGVIALLMSFLLKHGKKVSPHSIRAALLRTAIGCNTTPLSDCDRTMVGRIDVIGCITELLKGAATMIIPSALEQTQLASDSSPLRIPDKPETCATTAQRIEPSGCGCGATTQKPSPPQLVFAIGQIGIDLGSEARRDSLSQSMAPESANPADPIQLLAHLEKAPWDAAAIIWTLQLDSIPIYAIKPQGPFALDAYLKLRHFLADQIKEGAERVSIPGVVIGTIKLANGQAIPAIAPELRGMRNWTTSRLLPAIFGPAPDQKDTNAFSLHSQKLLAGREFLEKAYFELRNLGMTSQERAINYAATNAYNLDEIVNATIKDESVLDNIQVERSPICRPESDCWDVRLNFFYPKREANAARRAFRFTVDVSDIVPVSIGAVQSWHLR